MVGARLPNLSAYVSDPPTPWTKQTFAGWSSERNRPIQLLSGAAVWYHTGLPPVPMRWVLIRDPWGRFATQAVLCTDLTADPLQIVSWFILRWQLEVTFREVRAHLGVPDPTPVVGARDCSHHTGAPGPVLPGNPARP